MSQDSKERALRKILACLRLAKSANPNEASAALRQAQKLMQEFGIGHQDVAAAEVTSETAKARRTGERPPRWLVALANVIAAGFRCEAVFNIGWTTTEIEFIGLYPDPKIAAYAFLQLRRQIELDSSRHLSRVRKRANREARGDAFREGWVQAVMSMFPSAAMTDEREGQIEAWKRIHKPKLSPGESREAKRISRSSVDDRVAGIIAGSRAKVRSGLDGCAPKALEHQGSPE